MDLTSKLPSIFNRNWCTFRRFSYWGCSQSYICWSQTSWRIAGRSPRWNCGIDSNGPGNEEVQDTHLVYGTAILIHLSIRWSWSRNLSLSNAPWQMWQRVNALNRFVFISFVITMSFSSLKISTISLTYSFIHSTVVFRHIFLTVHFCIFVVSICKLYMITKLDGMCLWSAVM